MGRPRRLVTDGVWTLGARLVSAKGGVRGGSTVARAITLASILMALLDARPSMGKSCCRCACESVTETSCFTTCGFLLGDSCSPGYPDLANACNCTNPAPAITDCASFCAALPCLVPGLSGCTFKSCEDGSGCSDQGGTRVCLDPAVAPPSPSPAPAPAMSMPGLFYTTIILLLIGLLSLIRPRRGRRSG